MKKNLLIVLILFLLTNVAWAIDFGAKLNGTFDFISPSKKLQFTNTDYVFASTEEKGFTGIEALFTLVSQNKMEFSFGINYFFEQKLQSNTGSTWSYNTVIKEQTLNLLGFKLIQIGYRIPITNLLIVPFGGLGIYMATSKATLVSDYASGNSEATFKKLYASVYAGASASYKVTENIYPSLALQADFPLDLNDDFEQSGAWWYVGDARDSIEKNMEPKSGAGFSAKVGIDFYF